ncbi:membrane-spanning 4-domains subfamily A member 4A isoform X2 [Alosa sapidissima]|uniref:membrane-spanning 4-domains subfamily A member 4A isoform X2 n=1 Tax=Alosa sapidissima TaxID=34773 RepID=UPI001C08DFA0|nr:membrane-spanning 4-domains subfamily A member 4A isoform X2 [Alosa sapidissima]
MLMQHPSSTMANSPTNGMVVLTHLYPQQGIENDLSHHTGVIQPASSQLRGFLKREPAVLGTVQIMTGMVIFLLGIVSAFVGTLSTYFGIMFWGAIIYITAGSLTVRASKELNQCLVNASLGMNIASTITAGLAIILHSFDFIVPMYPNYSCSNHYDDYSCLRNKKMFLSRVWGMTGVLLVLSVLEFIVSLSVSAFACEATCSSNIGVIYISSQVPPSIPTSHLPTPPVNTSETPICPASVGLPAHLSRADDWGIGKPEDPPPEYTATQD